jgi:hypothetical protein
MSALIHALKRPSGPDCVAGHLLRTLCLTPSLAGLLTLAACASEPAAQYSYRTEFARVVSAMPQSEPAAQEACPPDADGRPNAPPDQVGFCVVYEHQGQLFSVWLPSPPGEVISIQVPVLTPVASPVPLPPSGVTYVPYPWVYPGVFYSGVRYRPRPYVAPYNRTYVVPIRPHVDPLHRPHVEPPSRPPVEPPSRPPVAAPVRPDVATPIRPDVNPVRSPIQPPPPPRPVRLDPNQR